MISSKILIQSAAAGLVAGAVITLPWVLCDRGDEVDRDRPHSVQSVDARVTTPQRPRHDALQPKTVRVEPPTRSPDLEARNRAAQRALRDLETLEHQRRVRDHGGQVAHRVTVKTRGHQTAQRVDDQVRTHVDGRRAASRIFESATVHVERPSDTSHR